MVTLIAAMLLVSAGVKAQSGRVTLRGSVSETVALSAVPNLTHEHVHVDLVRSGNTVRIALSGDDMRSAIIRVPLLVRSNTGFKISGAVESKAALTELWIGEVQATGTMVSAHAVSDLNVPPQLDLRDSDENLSARSVPLPEDSNPFLIVSGPRISLGGTLDSPNNALQLTVLIRMRPQSAGRWLVHLTFAGTAETQ